MSTPQLSFQDKVAREYPRKYQKIMAKNNGDGRDWGETYHDLEYATSQRGISLQAFNKLKATTLAASKVNLSQDFYDKDAGGLDLLSLAVALQAWHQQHNESTQVAYYKMFITQLHRRWFAAIQQGQLPLAQTRIPEYLAPKDGQTVDVEYLANALIKFHSDRQEETEAKHYTQFITPATPPARKIQVESVAAAIAQVAPQTLLDKLLQRTLKPEDLFKESPTYEEWKVYFALALTQQNLNQGHAPYYQELISAVYKELLHRDLLTPEQLTDLAVISHQPSLISHALVGSFDEKFLLLPEAGTLETPLMKFVRAGQAKQVNILLDLTAMDKAEVNRTDKLGNTALHHAAALGNVQIVHALIKKGAEFHHRNAAGLDAAAVAEKNGHTLAKDRLITREQVKTNKDADPRTHAERIQDAQWKRTTTSRGVDAKDLQTIEQRRQLREPGLLSNLRDAHQKQLDGYLKKFFIFHSKRAKEFKATLATKTTAADVRALYKTELARFEKSAPTRSFSLFEKKHPGLDTPVHFRFFGPKWGYAATLKRCAEELEQQFSERPSTPVQVK